MPLRPRARCSPPTDGSNMPAHDAEDDSGDFAVMTFKKGPQGLNVFITDAPAQGGATAIQYSADRDRERLAVPEGRDRYQFAPEQAEARLFTGGAVTRRRRSSAGSSP